MGTSAFLNGWKLSSGLIAALLAAHLAQPARAEVTLLEAGPCPAERAVYELRVPDDDAVWRLGFVPARTVASMASDLYLRLTTPQRDYWFTFSVAQGYGGTSVFPITSPYNESGPRNLLAEPYGDNPDGASAEEVGGWLRFLGLDADLNVTANPPMRGETAPAYLLLPEIGLGLWYAASAFTDDPAADRDPMPVGLFKRSGCLVVSPLPALP
jgi:hypothetical protein